MTAFELREEIGFELELMATVVAEVCSLLNDLAGREPTLREKTAAAAFITQFYGGVENILKRIHRYHGIQMPIGDSWHIDVFRRFCKPSFLQLPQLFDEELAADLAPFRKFRHVVYHGYGFQLEWERMKEGLQALENVHERLMRALTVYQQGLPL